MTMCTAIIQSVMTTFIQNKSVATIRATVQNISKIRCVERCNKERQKGMCTLAGYNKATKTCYLSIDNPKDIMDTADEMAGVILFDSDLTGLYRILFMFD